MTVNTSDQAASTLAGVLQVLAQPARIKILIIIAQQEACVCHLEAALGLRQAAVSQNLMALRDAGLVTTHRCGHNVFYRLANPGLCAALYQMAAAAGISQNELAQLASQPAPNCPCPHCNPNADPDRPC